MLVIDYETVKECIEEIEESIHLITTLDDINVGEALDILSDTKIKLERSLDDFETNLETMSEYYEE